MSELRVVARLKVHDGKLDDFKSVAQTCLDSVVQKDKATLQYDWFINDTNTECVVHELYPDSGALLAHVTNLGATMGELMAVADLSIEIYGTPSAELMQATEGMGIVVYSYFQGHRE